MEWTLLTVAMLVAMTSSLILAVFSVNRARNKQDGRNLPLNWPVLGMLPTIIANADNIIDHITSTLQESPNHTFAFKGPWFSGMDYLFTCDPANAKHMFNSHLADYPKGDEFTQIFGVLGDGLFNVDGESWAEQRRVAHARISDPRFRSFVERCTREKVRAALLPLLDDMAGAGKVFDLYDVFMRFTFDTTTTLVFGADLGSLSPAFPTIPFGEAIHRAEQLLVFRHLVPMSWWKLLRRLRVWKEREMAEALEVVDDFIARVITAKRSRINGGSNNIHVDGEEPDFDLLTTYMDSAAKFDDMFLRDTLLNFLAAGKDTTGAALTWLFWSLAKHPLVEKKLVEELEKISHRRGDQNEMFTAEEIEESVYLEAVVREALRLYPPLPYNHKAAAKADVLPSGHRVEPGTKILFLLYSMGRMEGVWGPDCMEFKPERWIADDGKLVHVPSYKFIAFHSGPRSCLGKNMAMAQIKMVAATVVYNFSVEVVDGHVPAPKTAMVLQAENGLLVTLKKRELFTS